MSSRLALLTSSLVLATALLVLIAGSEGRSGGRAQASLVTGAPTGESGTPSGLPATREPPGGDVYCLSCHADRSLSSGFTDGRPLSLYTDARALRDSAHGLMSCVTCHDFQGPHPAETASLPDFSAYRIKAVEACAACHQAAAEGYATSAHREPLSAGDDGATCIECHAADGSAHSVSATSGRGSILSPPKIADRCGSCHEQSLSTYLETSHGKVALLGDANTTATCVTCHGDHDVRDAASFAEPGALARLAAICGECHADAGESFARAWPGHSEGAPHGSTADVMGRVGYFMVLGVVASGLAHVSLDVLRRLSSKSRRSM